MNLYGEKNIGDFKELIEILKRVQDDKRRYYCHSEFISESQK